MSLSTAEKRAEIAAAVSTVPGVTGYERRPPVIAAGDAWPMWRGDERDEAWAFMRAWAVMVVLPQDERSADEWADSHVDALFEALESVLFVERIDPAKLTVSGDDLYALMITGRSE